MLTSLTLLVLSQSPQAWRLGWRAPEGCSSAAELQRALEVKLGQPVFREPAEAFIEGEVVPEGGGFKAKVSVTDAKGTSLGQREVSSAEPSCPAIDSRLVFVLSFLVDPSGQLRSGGVRSTPAPTPSLPAVRAPGMLLSPDDLVQLRVESPARETRVVEERQGRTSGDGKAWAGTVDVCAMPCSVSIRRGAVLRVQGGDVVPASFTLGELRGGRGVAVVKPASIARLTWSIVGLSFATSLLSLGIVGLVLSGNSSGLQGLSVGAGVGALVLGGFSIWGLSQGPTRVEVSDE